MIIITESTVFNTGAQALVNTINSSGTMGAGIALEFALRYPKMYEDYKGKCENKLITTGKVDYYHIDNDLVIVNFPTKQYYAYPSKLIWIEQGLKDFVLTYKSHGIYSAAFPKLGCANGKLSWSDVKPMMLHYLEPLNIDIYICESTKKDPEGIEKDMVDAYNRFIDGQEDVSIKLSDKQAKAIFDYGKVKRFFEIRDIPGIKGAPYKRIFNTFFHPHVKEQQEDQYNFFESM